MEKISRIIPTSARTKAVDVSKSQPVRPGAPTWGRTVGKVTTRMPIEDRIEVSTAERGQQAAEINNPLNYNNKGTLAKTKIVEDLSNKFFNSTPKSLVRDGDETLSEQVQARVLEQDFRADSSSDLTETATV